MNDISKLKCLVYDHGQNVPLARKLGESLSKVYYACPWESAFPRIENRVIGEGFDEIERVESPYDVVDRVDLVVFPDTLDASFQLFLEKLGVPVWGARRSDNLEIKKLWMKKLMESVGEPVADYKSITGIENLRKHLKQNDGLWVKSSPQFRGMKESFFHSSYDDTAQVLSKMQSEYGAMGEQTTFLVESPIEGDLESGIDTYCIDGKKPKSAFSGWEIKDKCYFGEVKDVDKIDKSITSPSEFLWEILGELRCRQFVSTEVIIGKNGIGKLLEPTIRVPNPPGNEMIELMENIPNIITSGASGLLVEPEWSALYACEATIERKGDLHVPWHLSIPEEEDRWIKLEFCARIGKNRYWGSPVSEEFLGSVVGIGDSPLQALEHLKANAECLDKQPVHVHLTDLAKAIDEIESAREDGVKSFNRARMPEPAEVLS